MANKDEKEKDSVQTGSNDDSKVNQVAEYPYTISWNVPRICIPTFLGPVEGTSLLPTKGKNYWEWWFYVGYVQDTDGNYYSIESTINRDSFIAFSLLCIGDETNNKFYRVPIKHEIGFFKGSVTQTPPSYTIESGTMKSGYRTKYNYIGYNNYNNKYFNNTNDNDNDFCIGMIGCQYNIASKQIMKQENKDNTENKENKENILGINLYVEDMRGSLLEGNNGRVKSTYEFTQPRLTILDTSNNNNNNFNSTITINNKEIKIKNGNLSLDRQIMLSNNLNKNGKQRKALYIGHWILLTLNDGTCLTFVGIWDKLISDNKENKENKLKQWQACSATGFPPNLSYGVVYNSYDDNYHHLNNGGKYLRGYSKYYNKNINKLDFDVNILIPSNPDISPHWQSNETDNEYTYGTAWTININGFYKSPQLYLYSMVDSCENKILEQKFWEGAVKVYTDAARKNLIGYGWFEQYGMN